LEHVTTSGLSCSWCNYCNHCCIVIKIFAEQQ